MKEENNSYPKNYSIDKWKAIKDFKKIIVFFRVLLIVFSVSSPVFAQTAHKTNFDSKTNQNINQEPAIPTTTPILVDSLTITMPTSNLTNPGELQVETIITSSIATISTITNTLETIRDEINSQGPKTYYLSPTGSDSSSGTSADSPWLTPNHTINCGDTILAAPSTSYNASNFTSGKWGTVSCVSGNNVAWLKCSSFDSCKVEANGNDAIRVSESYWGVQGWETTNSSGACFTASPASSIVTIHHIIFANNIANGCKNNGFNSYPYSGTRGPSGVDYLAIIGNLVYNAAGGNSKCFSGISVYEPRNFDTKPGTHIYITQNISWSNVNESSCPGNSDGNGIILDDWSGDQSSFTIPYSGQGVVENNLVMGNGSSGIEAFHNSIAPIIIHNNTSYANYTDPNHKGSYKGEILISWSSNVTSKYNIANSIVSSGGESNYPIYAFYIGKGDSVNNVDYLWAYSKFGNNTGINNSPGFSFGSHLILGTAPNFSNPSVPGAPMCKGTVNTLDCMKVTLANFEPFAKGIADYGYQPVINAFASNNYHPSWLCNVTIPNGLISNYCNSENQPPKSLPFRTFLPILTHFSDLHNH